MSGTYPKSLDVKSSKLGFIFVYLLVEFLYVIESYVTLLCNAHLDSLVKRECLTKKIYYTDR